MAAAALLTTTPALHRAVLAVERAVPAEKGLKCSVGRCTLLPLQGLRSRLPLSLSSGDKMAPQPSGPGATTQPVPLPMARR